MDWRNEEIDQSRDEKGLVKSKSYVNLPGLEDRDNRFEGNKESKCFTSGFENLKLDAGINHEIDRSPFPESKVAKTSPFEYKFEAKAPLCGFRNHEKCCYRLVIQGAEISNYQGTLHSPEDVAPCWKKDSRMWLWKSVRYARRKNKIKCSVNQNLLKNRLDVYKQRGGPSERIN
ncbi:uncharacterized protein LOC117167772 isoform X2 [Belonocnema kinseyi]|uniref:uncharacterized protein LOC117167772 isoform X2 n=1 Tax=Belonocnema kinseyi TaxID=2817044 RepID=UPI00143E0587|nr:uncharacterized protein LOC117167772 isoform X2 [Belonocnema kinseyi]